MVGSSADRRDSAQMPPLEIRRPIRLGQDDVIAGFQAGGFHFLDGAASDMHHSLAGSLDDGLRRVEQNILSIVESRESNANEKTGIGDELYAHAGDSGPAELADNPFWIEDKHS